MSLKLRLLLLYLNYFSPQTDYSKLTAEKLRRINEKEEKKSAHLVDFKPIEMQAIENRHIPMRDGVEIPIRIYRPIAKEHLPTIVFYHGGGFTCRSIDSHDKVCRRVAKMNRALVVSTGYRLAPEHKFPGPVHDAYDAALWVSKNAKAIGGDKNRLVLMGDSAGGNLSAVVCILARDSKAFDIKYQVLVYPSTDARLQHPSIEKYKKGYILSKEGIHWFLDQYKSTDQDIFNPLMSPLLTEDLSNLPPAFVSTAEFDPLKDEGQAFAERLQQAGNQVIFKEYSGVVHAFFNLPKITQKALRLHEDIQQILKPILYPQKSQAISYGENSQ